MTAAHLLVAVDLSTCSRAALDHAAEMRRQWAATVDVVYLWDVEDEEEASAEDPRLHELEVFCRGAPPWELLDELAAREHRGELRVRGYLTKSPAGRPLVELAARAGYDLVIVGTRAPLDDARLVLHGEPSSARWPTGWCGLVSMGA
jgi:nucleotide-binding universal stress UspA family protein